MGKVKKSLRGIPREYSVVYMAVSEQLDLFSQLELSYWILELGFAIQPWPAFTHPIGVICWQNLIRKLGELKV